MLPENNRHKPIARCYPGLTPVGMPIALRRMVARGARLVPITIALLCSPPLPAAYRPAP